MNFHNSNMILHLIWLLPGIVLISYFGYRKRRARITAFVSSSSLASVLTTNISIVKRRFRDILFLAGMFFVIAALAGPHWGTKLVKRPSHSRDLLIALDCSKSMLATDISPSRLKHAKWFIRELINRTPGDRYGLIAFSGTAFLECPLTQDRNGFLLFLDDVDTDTIPVGGTNIEESLQTALAAFKAAEGGHRAIILITDGDELQGDAGAILDELKERNIPIFAVGIGNPNLGSFIQIEGNKFITDKAGNRVNTKLNEAGLRRIAEAVGGTYVHSTVVHDGIDHVAGKVRALIPQQQEENTVSKPIEKYQVPLLVGFLCLLVRMLLGERKAVSKEKSLSTNKRAAPIRVTVLQLLCFCLCWYGVPSRLIAQDEGDFKEEDASGGVGQSSGAPIVIGPQVVPGAGAKTLPNPQGRVPQHPMDESGIKEEKLKLIEKSIESLRGKIEKIDDPIELGYLHYNLGVNYQLLGQRDEAGLEYNKALDVQAGSDELEAVTYQNLGVLKHSEARQNLSINPDNALQSLLEAQDYYREAMRKNPKLESVARNQELVLQERRLIEELKKMQENLNDLQENAQDAAEEAHEAQQAVNQSQNPTNKEQNQQNALDKTQEAQKAASELEQAASDIGQENAADWVSQAVDQLGKAAEEQKKALNSLSGRQTSESENSGEKAEEHIGQALRQLGVQKEEKKDESEGEPDENVAGQEAAAEDEKAPSEEDKDNKPNFELAEDTSPSDGQQKEGNQEQLQDLSNLQTLRILEDLQQTEKDLKQELKQMQKQNSRLKEVDRNW